MAAVAHCVCPVALYIAAETTFSQPTALVRSEETNTENILLACYVVGAIQ